MNDLTERLKARRDDWRARLLAHHTKACGWTPAEVHRGVVTWFAGEGQTAAYVTGKHGQIVELGPMSAEMRDAVEALVAARVELAEKQALLTRATRLVIGTLRASGMPMRAIGSAIGVSGAYVHEVLQSITDTAESDAP